MNVLFTIYGLNQPTRSSKVQHLFDERGGFIGRSDQCEWVLPDKSKKISRKHAHITYNNDNFYIDDVSSNGLYQALHHTQIIKGTPHKIENGEGFIIGDFSIKATFMQSPASYTRPMMNEELEKISQVDPISLNPLQAMDQEEDIILDQRMGDLEDFLIIQKETSLAPQQDHVASIHSQVSINASSFKSDSFISEDWDAEPDTLNTSSQRTSNNTSEPYSGGVDSFSQDTQIISEKIIKKEINSDIASKSISNDFSQDKQTTLKLHEQVSLNDESINNKNYADINKFFTIIGFQNPPDDEKEKQEVIAQVAELFVSMLDGLTHTMQHRAEAKNELRLPITLTNFTVQNNPFKYCPTSQAVLAVLLGPTQKGVMKPKEAIEEAFNDLHKHHLGLLAGTRAAVQSILYKLSPQAIDSHLDSNKSNNFMKNHKRWNAFLRIHQGFKADNEKFQNIFRQDFARAYEVQGKTLSPKESWFKPKGEL